MSVPGGSCRSRARLLPLDRQHDFEELKGDEDVDEAIDRHSPTFVVLDGQDP